MTGIYSVSTKHIFTYRLPKKKRGGVDMENKKIRVPLYRRLPEIYRIKDQEQNPPGQLKSYLALVENVFAEIHKNIETLYHDLFIETCDDWVIPYIGDLLGVSHLKGDPATLRADVADTIALRRRKGTLAGMERLTYNLTRWGVHCVELRENLVWNQHLNHQRPDVGGDPPYGLPSVTRFTPIRGGTVTLRDPAMLSLLYTPFDPFAHLADVKPPALGNTRYNLPNLAIFLWRLRDYRVTVSKPVPPSPAVHENVGVVDDEAAFIVCFNVHPLGEPVRLFNTYQFDPDKEPPVVTQLDQTPGPILTPRLTADSPAGAPGKYVSVNTYDDTGVPPGQPDISDVGFQLHLPQSEFTGSGWSIRGANLHAWEECIRPPVNKHEIVIDPVIGRFVVGVETSGEADALIDHLLITYTYGAVGPVGAHPVTRLSLPADWQDKEPKTIEVTFTNGSTELKDALNQIDDPLFRDHTVIILIRDSRTYELDIDDVDATLKKNEGGAISLLLKKSLVIRAADDERPVIKLVRPLRFRPKKVKGADADEQKLLDAEMDRLTVRLEGLYLTRGDNWDAEFAPNPEKVPLVARAALHRLEIIGCTLDPGGYKKLDDTRAPIYTALDLKEDFGFPGVTPQEIEEKNAFDQIPEISIQQSITGPLLIDTTYQLSLSRSIIDAGKGVGDDPPGIFALSSAGDPVNQWGPPTTADGITVFGRVRVEQISEKGVKGAIFVHTLEVLNHQTGCIKSSYFSGSGDRLPRNHGCVKGTEAVLRFVSEIFGQPAYGQLHHTTDFRVRERGPGDDAMGAYGFLMEAHKWRNLQIRFREFMPVGVRPLLIPVT
jgi:hypothetical protein